MRHKRGVSDKFQELRKDHINLWCIHDHRIVNTCKLRDLERNRNLRIYKCTVLIRNLSILHLHCANLNDVIFHSTESGCLDIKHHICIIKCLIPCMHCDICQIIYQICFHPINHFERIIFIKPFDKMIRIRECLHNTVIRDCNRRMSPVVCSFYNLIHIRDTIHITHLRVAVKFHPFLCTCILFGRSKIRNFFYSGNGANRQFTVEFVDGCDTFDFQKRSCFHLSKQLRKLIISHKQFYHDRICKIGHCKHDNGLFVSNLTCIKACHLSAECDLSHLSDHL